MSETDAYPEVLFWKGRAADAVARAEAAEAQRDTLAKAMLEVERLSHVKSSTWGIARAALAAVAPPEEQP